MADEKKRGGARPNSGRKKREAPVRKIDGRTVTGKSHAAELIEQLNAIDPQLMEDLVLVVSCEPIEIPDDGTAKEKRILQHQEALRRLTCERKQRAEKKFQKLSFEVQGWAMLWFSSRTGLETRKYLYDKADGKAVITVNHVHDKPIEHHVTYNLAETVEKARKRANSL